MKTKSKTVRALAERALCYAIRHPKRAGDLTDAIITYLLRIIDTTDPSLLPPEILDSTFYKTRIAKLRCPYCHKLHRQLKCTLAARKLKAFLEDPKFKELLTPIVADTTLESIEQFDSDDFDEFEEYPLRIKIVHETNEESTSALPIGPSKPKPKPKPKGPTQAGCVSQLAFLKDLQKG